jgi:hypothetical protein
MAMPGAWGARVHAASRHVTPRHLLSTPPDATRNTLAPQTCLNRSKIAPTAPQVREPKLTLPCTRHPTFSKERGRGRGLRSAMCSLLPAPCSLLPAPAPCSPLPARFLLPACSLRSASLLPTRCSLFPARVPAPCSLLPAPCSLLPAPPCSLLPAPCSLLPAPCSLLPAPCSLLRRAPFSLDGFSLKQRRCRQAQVIGTEPTCFHRRKEALGLCFGQGSNPGGCSPLAG